MVKVTMMLAVMMPINDDKDGDDIDDNYDGNVNDENNYSHAHY